MKRDTNVPTITSKQFHADSADAVELARQHGVVVITDDNGEPRSFIATFDKTLPTFAD